MPHYIVKGMTRDNNGFFNWVIDAESETQARSEAKKSLSKEDFITDVEPISVEKCIERLRVDLSYEIKRFYFDGHFDADKVTVGKYGEARRSLDENSEQYYQAFKEFYKAVRFMLHIDSILKVNSINPKKLKKCISAVAKARNEEETHEALNELKNNE